MSIRRGNLLPVIRSWEREKLFFEGDAFFDGMLAEIAEAREWVDFESYIFEDDGLGRLVMEALSQAASRGVRVRLLIDGIGSSNLGSGPVHFMKSRGVDVRVFHPLRWPAFWNTLNRRNHRKVCVVDGRSAWLGSMNVTSDHSERFKGKAAWRDTGIRVEGPDVVEYARAFEMAWRNWRSFPRLRHGKRFRVSIAGAPVRLNYTTGLRMLSFWWVVQKFASARRRIWITNAYFVPDGALLRALRRAARRKVDVKIIVPGQSDLFFMPWVASAFYYSLLKSGVEIYEYQGRVLHAKTILVDGDGMVGSRNLNHRSMKHDLEADALITHPESVTAMEEQFLRDLTTCQQVGREHWKNRPWYQRFLGRFALMIRFFL